MSNGVLLSPLLYELEVGGGLGRVKPDCCSVPTFSSVIPTHVTYESMIEMSQEMMADNLGNWSRGG